MTDQNQQKMQNESKMINDDPAFDPSWDIKVAQGGDKTESATAGNEKPAQAALPVDENKPVSAVQTKQEDKQQAPPMASATPPKVVPLPPLPEGTPPPKQGQAQTQNQTQNQAQPQSQAVTPIPAPIQQEKKEVSKKHKIIWGDVLSCWVLGTGAILIFLLIVLFFVVKSGIINVPFLIDWLYNAPMPTRFVAAQPQGWEEFRGMVTNRLLEQDLDSEPPIMLPLTEVEFTGLLNGVIAEGLRSTEYRADIAQVVILPDSLELYFYLTWRDLLTFEILTHLVPFVEDDGTLRFEVAGARFGDLPLPGPWVMRVIGYFFARDVGAWRIVLSNGYGIQSASLVEQQIRLFIGPVSVE